MGCNFVDFANAPDTLPQLRSTVLCLAVEKDRTDAKGEKCKYVCQPRFIRDSRWRAPADECRFNLFPLMTGTSRSVALVPSRAFSMHGRMGCFAVGIASVGAVASNW
jgi:hypothetical protein